MTNILLAQFEQFSYLFNFDSYKASHPDEYPDDIEEMTAYGEFRKAFPGCDDDRIVVVGGRYLTEKWLEKQWKMEDLKWLDLFMSTHNAGGTPYDYPRDLFVKFITENDGYFPIKFDCLPDGTVVYPHTTVYRMTAKKAYARLVTFMETIATEYIWYPSTVATLSRHARTAIEEAFAQSVDADAYWKLESRLHDFGFRGTTCVEQAMIGGAAHLLNFRGSDTVVAAAYAQFCLNGGISVAESIPATEHSVMTSWPTVDGKETPAVLHMINKYGDGVFATVGDSYDWNRFLIDVVQECAPLQKTKKGFWVVRPDSGDPVVCVLEALLNLEKAFGVTINSKGYKVINGAGVIQGDGIDLNIIKQILKAVMDAGFSAENVAFGMGAGLLQKVNRDTMSFATKLCFIVWTNGEKTEVWKHPKTDTSKVSFPGLTQVNWVGKGDGTNAGSLKTFALPDHHWEDCRVEIDELQTTYDCGPVEHHWLSFDLTRANLLDYHRRMDRHGTGISQALADKIAAKIAA